MWSNVKKFTFKEIFFPTVLHFGPLRLWKIFLSKPLHNNWKRKSVVKRMLFFNSLPNNVYISKKNKLLSEENLVYCIMKSQPGLSFLLWSWELIKCHGNTFVLYKSLRYLGREQTYLRKDFTLRLYHPLADCKFI